MITPLLAAQLVKRAYDPGLVAGGVVPDLSDLGYHPGVPLYATDRTGPACYGYFAAAVDFSGQFLAIRGTIDDIEWVEDATIKLVPNPWGPGLVHSGFAALVASIGVTANQVDLTLLIGALTRVSVGGHSLGAAMARLLTMRFKSLANAFTWGEPKSAEQTAAEFGVSCISGTNHRGVNERDLVPMVPEYVPLIFPYVHGVIETTLGKFGDTPQQAHAMDTYIALETACLTAA